MFKETTANIVWVKCKINSKADYFQNYLFLILQLFFINLNNLKAWSWFKLTWTLY
jgi:hypothetical protein